MWRMVFCGNGLTYTELRNMDIAEFQEAYQARVLWQERWNKPKPK
jgi:hypothetical protein